MSYDNPRINDLSMTPMDIIMSMGEGNPGGIRVMCESMKLNPIIDPDDAFADIGALISLDTLDCYGTNIWAFFKYICDQNYENMFGVLRAIQLGFISDVKVMECIKSIQDHSVETKTIDVEDLSYSRQKTHLL